MSIEIGWTHEEARKHSIVARLFERCARCAQDFMACPEQPPDDLPHELWCERCLAAELLVELLGAPADCTTEIPPRQEIP